MESAFIDLVIKTFGSALAIYGFAVVLDTPKKYLLRAALVGGVSGLVYWIAVMLGCSDVLASFWSAFAVALLSHLFARAFKVPVTLFLVAGMLPTVPGGGMYRTVHSFIEQDGLLSYNLKQTLAIAGVIALAIFLVDSFFALIQKGGWKQNSLKYVKILKPKKPND